MSAMICNCNAIGNIDYGVPILFKTPDYRTSTGVGTKFIPSINQEFYSGTLSNVANTAEIFETRQDSCKTQNARDFGYKHQKWNPSGKANLPNRVPKTHYMITVKEKMFKNPPAPRPFKITESKSEYTFKQIEESLEKVPNPESQATCRLSELGKGEQPRIMIESPGVMKIMDTYVTTTQLAYVPFTRNDLEISKRPIITFYEAKNSPELKMSNIKKPLVDEVVFKKEIKNRIVPKLVYRVPYSGKTSEYKGSYVPPTKGCFYSHLFDCGVNFDDSLSGPSKLQTLTAPNMYCTEHCHIGTGWPVRAAVNPKEADKAHVFKHEPCSNFNK